jgi:hypothetical protein
MQASPLIRTRLLLEENDGGQWQEPLSVEDPSVYLACLDALKNIGVDVRRTKVGYNFAVRVCVCACVRVCACECVRV